MNSKKRIPVLAAALAGSLLAGTPIAKLTTPDAVTVKGVALPSTDQVAAYPLSLNDEIATKDKPASLEFADGSKVTVAAGSTVRLEQGKTGTAVRVIRGNVAYRLAAQSKVEILNAAGQRIGGGLDSKMAQAMAATSAQQPRSVRRSASSDATDSSSSNLLTRAYVTGGAHATSAADTTQIVLPNGMTLIVAQSPGNPNSFTIQQIVVPITAPAGSTGPTSIPVTSGPLIGASLSTPSGPSSSGAPAVSITLPGQTTPLTPDQAAQQLTSTAQQGVSNAVAQGQLPAGTTATPPGSPVSTPPTPAPPSPPPVRVSPAE